MSTEPFVRINDRLRSKIGKFSIPESMMMRDSLNIMGLMQHCIIVRCELVCGVACMDYEYTAYSYRFDSVEPGYLMPWYTWEFSKGRWNVINEGIKYK